MKLIISVDSLGDLLNITPIIRKLATGYCKKTNERLRVYCKNPIILKNNPYCEVFELKDEEWKVDDPDEDYFQIRVHNQNKYMLERQIKFRP